MLNSTEEKFELLQDRISLLNLSVVLLSNILGHKILTCTPRSSGMYYVVNPLAHRSDHNRISSHNINTISSRQVTRNFKKYQLGGS